MLHYSSFKLCLSQDLNDTHNILVCVNINLVLGAWSKVGVRLE